MPRLRRSTTARQHAAVGRACEAWPTDLGEALARYVLRQGVLHLVARGWHDRAQARLADLDFFGAYLVWCYEEGFDDFTPALRLWRLLGDETAGARYEAAAAAYQPSTGTGLAGLRRVVEFVRDADWKDAMVPVAEAALQAHTQRLGANHAETAACAVELGLALKNRNQPAEAQQVIAAALAVQRRELHPDDPALYVTVNSLASTEAACGHFAVSQTLYEEALAQRTRLLGPEHPKTLVSLASLAYLFTKQGLHQTAAPLHQQVVDKRTRALGPDHPKTLTACVNLGRALTELGRFAEAEPHLVRAVERRRALLGAAHARTRNAERRLQACRDGLAAEAQ